MNGEPRWPNEAPAAALELYPAFDETLTSGLEDAVRDLPKIRELSHLSDEARLWQFKVIEDLTSEVKKLRGDLGNVVRALDKKASLLNQARFEKTLSEHFDRRINTIRSISMWAIGVLFVVDGLIKVIR